MNNRVEFAHSLRGIAALSVVMCHIIMLFCLSPLEIHSLVGVTEYSKLDNAVTDFFSILAKYFYFNLGAFGVVIFFLISGFVIPFSMKKNNRRQFFVSRWMRIVPTYAVGYAFSCIMVMIAAYYEPYCLLRTR